MKHLTKKLLPLTAVLICTLCSKPITNPVTPSRGDTSPGDEPRSDITSPGDEGKPQIPEGKSIWVSAVLEREDGSKELALYKDGAKEFGILCSDEGHISDDPDTHFLTKGILFTTFTDNSATYISRNGKLLYAIKGREYIKSLLWDGQNIWTLSIPLDEEGFRVRKNAAEFFSKTDGTPLSFYMDGADLYLSFYSLLAGNRVTYLMKNDNCVQIKGPHSLEVENIRIRNGQTCYIERSGRKMLMSYQDQEIELVCQSGFDIIDAEAIPYGEEDFTLILHMQSLYSPMPADLICNRDTTILTGAGTVCRYYFDNSSWWRICLTRNADKWFIYNASTDTQTTLEEVYIPSERCVCTDEGTLYVAASYKDTSIHPFVWAEDKKLIYRIKGTLTGICFSPPS